VTRAGKAIPTRADGVGGWLSFDGATVCIRRGGLWDTLAGVSGQRQLPVNQIADIIFEPHTRLKGRGYVRFVRADDPLAVMRRLIDTCYGPRDAKNVALLDEYALMFRRDQQAAMKSLVQAIRDARCAAQSS